MKIRYHHLMCIPRFRGEGYSESFCENMQKLKALINTESYELVENCDDVCAYCPNNIGGICKDSDKVRQYDHKVKTAIEQGKTPEPKDICSDCKWYCICSKL